MGSKCSGLTVRAEVDSEGISVTGVGAHQEVYATMITSSKEDHPKKGDKVHPQGKEISSDNTESTARQCG